MSEHAVHVVIQALGALLLGGFAWAAIVASGGKRK